MQISNDIHVIGPWVWQQMGDSPWFSVGKSAIGELGRWGVVYDRYEEGGSIHMHVAISSPKYVTRRAISAVFEYPFYQLGVKKVIANVQSTNYASLAFCLGLGFSIEAVIEDVYAMGDMYILSMAFEQCKWLRGREDGRLSYTATAA